MGVDTGLHASYVPEESQSPSSDLRLDVLEACAVLDFQVCYMIKPADLKNAQQATHVKSLQTIDIGGLEQGPCFSGISAVL